MVEPHLWSTNSNSTIPQPAQSWQNEQPFFTTTPTNHITNHQVFETVNVDDDDDSEFVNAVGPVSSRSTNSADLSKSIFDVVKNDFDNHSVSNDATHTKYHSKPKPHTITTGQMMKNGLNDLHSAALPNATSHLPQITIANFAKENVIANNGTNASKDLLYSINDADDWIENANFENHDFGNGHIVQLPMATVPSSASATSTTTAHTFKWENIFGEMKQNIPGPNRVITANQPRQVFNNMGGSFEVGRMKTFPTANDTLVTANFPLIPIIDPQNQASSHETEEFEQLLPQANEVNTNGVYQQIQVGPRTAEPNWIGPLLPQTRTSSSETDWIGQLLPQANIVNTIGIDKSNQPGPSTAQGKIGPLLPQTSKVSPNTVHHQIQPGLNQITHQQHEFLTNMGGYDRIIPPLNGSSWLINQSDTTVGTKRRRTATIPIKIVRSTKQYETLVEMGFPKKDIEIALRKCNLDLHATIEYLSEPKRTPKKRKTDHQFDPFHGNLLNEIEQSLHQPQTQQSLQQPVPEPVKKPANLYEELLQLEETGGIVKSIESFDCEICMETIEMKDGMILRNCLHRYCKDCLNGTIVHSDEVSIKCPYVSCDEMVQEREIRAVLSQDEYEKFLMKGVRVAQVTISGTVLCNFPDCNGWCICEDVVNEFKCPQCKNVNCIPCKAIHAGRNCREYQDDLAAGDANGIVSGQRRSEQAMQDLINRNEAMKCFSCGILIMKRDGCDYIQCVMCKVGICWATRGPRYGPAGVGDFSGGCKCSVEKKCHKDCRGCH